MLTFDDGQRDNIIFALPALVKQDLKAIFFVCPGLIEADQCHSHIEVSFLCKVARDGQYRIVFEHGNMPAAVELELSLSTLKSRKVAYLQLNRAIERIPSRLHEPFLKCVRESLDVHERVPDIYRVASYEELQELAATGMVVGNHSLYHSTIDVDGPEQFEHDLRDASAWLAQRFAPPRKNVFCYPQGKPGNITPESTNILSRLGFDYGLASQGGLAQIPPQSPLKLYRNRLGCSYSAAKATPFVAYLRHWRRYRQFGQVFSARS